MATRTLSSAKVKSVLDSLLEPGEEIRNWAVGRKAFAGAALLSFIVGSIPTVIIFTALGIRPGGGFGPWVMFLLLSILFASPLIIAITKNYVIGITEGRLLLLELRAPATSWAVDLSSKRQSFACSINEIKRFRCRLIKNVGGSIEIKGPGLSVDGIFHDVLMEGNREQLAAIAKAIGDR